MKDRNVFSLPEFDQHYKVIILDQPKTGLKGAIAIHRKLGTRPSFGATRMAQYKSPQAAAVEALKLSRLMTYKIATAKLPYGGAKAVIMEPEGLTPKQKKIILAAYAEQVNELKAEFITGADLGINEQNLKLLYKNSPYMVGLAAKPVLYTALGMYFALEVALGEIFGLKKIAGRTFAIQGVGKIGQAFLKLIYPQAKKIYIADTNLKMLKKVKQNFPKVKILTPTLISQQAVDVFSPCAMGGALNPASIKNLRCKMILGGANNQLSSPEVGNQLFELGILYAPDYVVNGGGLISVIDEYEYKIPETKRLTEKVKVIAKNLKEILEKSKKTNQPTHAVADRIAETFLAQNNVPKNNYAKTSLAIAARA